jgi:hypothetical protein
MIMKISTRETSVSRRVGSQRGAKQLLWSLTAAAFLMASLGSAAWATPLLPIQVGTGSGATDDLNPYGVVYVPAGFPSTVVQPGNILVANFNDPANDQGQGTTITAVRQDRTKALFASKLTPGLTAAMGILQAGYVLIGSITVPTVPMPDNFAGAVGGPITVLDSTGKIVQTLTSPLLDGPWGMAVQDNVTTAHVWVSNVLNGTVIRFNLDINPAATPPITVSSVNTVATGYNHINTNTMPLLGPSGLAYSAENHILFVSIGFDKIWAIPNADTITAPVVFGKVVYQDNVHFHGPLGLVLLPNGDLLSAQNDGFNSVTGVMPSELVEFTQNGVTGVPGVFVAEYSIDSVNGGAFNMAIQQNPDPIAPLNMAYVDDNENTVVQIALPTYQFGFGNVLLTH